jgi:energy-converting hydrogenase A subunit M
MAVLYQPDAEFRGGHEQQREDAVLEQHLQLQALAGLHARNRSASRRRIDNSRNNAITIT